MIDRDTVIVPDLDTLHRPLARLDVAMECAGKPCGTLDCCEFGAPDCPDRVLEGDPS